MKIVQLFGVSIFCYFLLITGLHADVIYVDSQSTFDNAHDNVGMNDSIIWRSGTYSDIFMDIDRNQMVIKAEELGSVIFKGASKVDISGDHITFEGFQFLDGDIGTSHVINVTGSHNLLTQLNIRAYTCYKYLRVKEESQYVEITYCNFENRLNLDDQNILSILVDDVNPGYHKIQYCSFKNFDGTGNDLGIEPIRIGVSTQADNISRTLVEYCYFTQCNGDGELISSKARQNVYRFNTFESNPKAELVLRHGSEAVVYGNFFLNGKGGVRVREGQDHYIYNNYFYEIDDRAIYLQNEDSDPLDNINIGFNTIVNCSEIILGGSGNDKPTNVTFANNIFSQPDDKLFQNPTGTETWIGNIAFGQLGISQPSSGMTVVDPQMSKNNEGFYGLTANSPAVNSAESGYSLIPQFDGMDDVDTDISFDLMKQNRPTVIAEKDLGCNEFPHTSLIKPWVTEENTGPSYNTSTATSATKYQVENNDLFIISPNPVNDLLKLTFRSSDKIKAHLDIFNTDGRKVDSLNETSISEELSITRNVEYLSPGVYIIRVTYHTINSSVKKIYSEKFIKL